jgi:hypothetical protein
MQDTHERLRFDHQNESDMDKHRLDKAKIEERMERAATAKKRKEAIVN